MQGWELWVDGQPGPNTSGVDTGSLLALLSQFLGVWRGEIICVFLHWYQMEGGLLVIFCSA